MFLEALGQVWELIGTVFDTSFGDILDVLETSLIDVWEIFQEVFRRCLSGFGRCLGCVCEGFVRC